jgi:type IV secretion system protein TrbF
MRGLPFRRGRTAPAAASAADSARRDSPYLAGRDAFSGAFGDLARARRNWQLVAFGLLALELLTLSGLLRLALESRITPYVVEVDRLGRAVAFGPAEKLQKTDHRILVAELTAFLRSARTVYADLGAQKDLLYRAYAYLAGPARATLDAYFARPENDPRLLAARFTRHVEVHSVLQIPDTRTWRVQWTEREEPVSAGLVRESAWEAHLTVVVRPPTTADFLQVNPLGIYITHLTWTRIARDQGATR